MVSVIGITFSIMSMWCGDGGYGGLKCQCGVVMVVMVANVNCGDGGDGGYVGDPF